MKKLIVLITFVVVFIGFVYVWWNNALLSVNVGDKSQHIFVIIKGEGIRSIANKLQKEGFIKDPIVFFLLVKQLGLDGKIQAGDFRLSPSMTTEQIAKELIHGTLDIWVVVQEGKRAEEIADILKEKIPSYKDVWASLLVKNEGYLFPDTYLIPKDADITLIISVMKGNFDRKFSQVALQDNSKLTRNEIVTLASLIEREAKFEKDRPLVASVFTNRLSLSMPLQIDATVQYALGYEKNEKTWWKKRLTKDDLKIDSPYNTYLVVGLPPTAIANPGLSALEAAANPAKTEYLYYISDSKGNLHFAKTLEEHNLNIRKYGL